ncbi:MAG: arylamine N-acetyltransferase [candidate division WOR-3 bacterium]
MLIKDRDLKAFEFLSEKFNLKKEENELFFLKKVLKIFSEIPYENLTKIIEAESKNFEKKLRTPYYIIRDFFEKGAGGTCFSLVYFLKNFLEYLGFKPCFLLADRSYGENTHTLVSLEIEGKKYLCDVGYLIYEPILLESDFFKFKTLAYDFIYEERKDGIYVYTESEKGFKKFRFKIKKEKVNEDDFISAWKKSFEFEMMNHVIVSKKVRDGIIYIRDGHFHKIKEGKTFYKKLEEREMIKIFEELNIKRDLILKVKGFIK